MKYFSLKNLAMTEVTEFNPLTASEIIPDYIKTKEDFQAWGKNSTTEGCFYSVIEGAAKMLRTSAQNQPIRIHGFIADYDSYININQETIQEVIKRGNPNCAPRYITATFSGKARLVWEFEDPIPWFGQEFAHAWNKYFLKLAKVKQLLPGFDENANKDTQYFALGSRWTEVSTRPVPRAILFFGAEQVSSKLKWKGGYTIPMETIAEEVEERFPGRWKGAFDVGARGCRFWDDSATNDTAAIVRGTGMQCFTGDYPFMSWKAIFGEAFVKKYEADRIGEAVGDIFYDGRNYWRKTPDGAWRDYTKEDIILHLVAAFGLESAKGKEAADLPEVKRAIYAIQNLRVVDGAVPCVGHHPGIVHINNEKVLNIARARPISPLECSEDEALTHVPFLREFTSYLLGPEQLPYFLHWLKRYYEGFLHYRPNQGQITFIAGDVGIGKTFLSTIVGWLMGGSSDASDYLMGKTMFNKELFHYPLWSIDDSTPSSSPTWHTNFSAMLKRMAANRTFMYNAKFKDTHQVPWTGRVIVTCNADPESMRVLPDTDFSMLDKMNLFKALRPPSTFRIPPNVETLVKKELPYFARYLLEFKEETGTGGGDRFGVKCWHHPELLEAARFTTKSHDFLELLRRFLKMYFQDNPKAMEWKGTATDLLVDIQLHESLKEISRNLKTVSIGRSLGQLMGQGAYPISNDRTHDGQAWVIRKTILGA